RAAVAELGGQHHPVPLPLERLAHERLAQAGLTAVRLGGVEQRDAGIDRGVQHGTGSRQVLGACPGSSEVVAAEAGGGHEQSGGAQAALIVGHDVHATGMRGASRRRREAPLAQSALSAGGSAQPVQTFGSAGGSGAAGGSADGGSGAAGGAVGGWGAAGGAAGG